MRVLVALDKFKHALSAVAANAAVADGLRAARPDLDIVQTPLTDGGDGFVAVLAAARGGALQTTTVPGPRGETVTATWCLVPVERLNEAIWTALRLSPGSLGGRPLAVVEMAQTAGLEQVPADQRDPHLTSTYGLGCLLREAVAAGAGAVLVGLGGSATSDLGLGALAALGLQGQDAQGADLGALAPATWPSLHRFHGRPTLGPDDAPVPLRLACDVTNPLLGPTGAAAVFGPQKGLPPAAWPAFDAQARRVSDLLLEHLGAPADSRDLPGAGAAGGLGWGLVVGLNLQEDTTSADRVQLVPGFDLVIAWLDLAAQVRASDAVITGEGRFDRSSLGGKGPGTLVALAHAAGKPVWVLAGAIGSNLGNPAPSPLTADRLIALTPPGEPMALAWPQTAARLQLAAARLARSF